MRLYNDISGCPVNVGDLFYKNDGTRTWVNPIIVTDIEEKTDDNGTYWIVSGKYSNETDGNTIRKFDSRMLTPDRYAIKRGSYGKGLQAG